MFSILKQYIKSQLEFYQVSKFKNMASITLLLFIYFTIFKDIQIPLLIIFYAAVYKFTKIHHSQTDFIKKTDTIQQLQRISCQLKQIKENISELYCVLKHLLMIQNEICFGTNVKVMFNILQQKDKNKKFFINSKSNYFDKLKLKIYQQNKITCQWLIQKINQMKNILQHAIKFLELQNQQFSQIYVKTLQILFSVQLRQEIQRIIQRKAKLNNWIQIQHSDIQYLQELQLAFEITVMTINLIDSIIISSNQIYLDKSKNQGIIQFDVKRYSVLKDFYKQEQNQLFSKNFVQFQLQNNLRLFFSIQKISQTQKEHFQVLYRNILSHIYDLRSQIKENNKIQKQKESNPSTQILVYSLNSKDQSNKQKNINSNKRQKQWIVTSQSIQYVPQCKIYDEKTSLTRIDKLSFMKQLDKMIVSGKIKASQKALQQKLKDMEYQMEPQNDINRVSLIH